MSKHTESSAHPVAMCTADLSFWCYQCDSYLHHLAIRPIYEIYRAFHLLKFGEPCRVPFGADSSHAAAVSDAPVEHSTKPAPGILIDFSVL